jgi:hypothetical protein
MKNVLHIVMAVMLLVCLGDMPYGYYQLVRFVAMAVFAYLAYEYYKLNRVGVCYTFVALALLFQPFFKVALGRTVWNIVDVIVAAFLMVLLLADKKREV